MDTVQAKVMTMVCLGASSLAAGLLPSWLMPATQTTNSLFLSALLCCGSGILFATSMVHMLPEVHAEIPQYAEIIACGGFLLLYLIDEVIHSINHKAGPPARQPCGENGLERSASGYGTVRNRYRSNSYGNEADGLLPARCLCDGEGAVCHVTEEYNNAQSASHIGLLLALGIHSVLEGLAIGVQTLPAKVIVLGGAVASHKLVVAFGLGVELTAVRDNSRCSVLFAMATFSLCSVLGIGVGMAVSHGDGVLSGSKVLPVMQGMAVGTLLYVTLSEVLPRERIRFHHSPSRWRGFVQFLSVLSGFGIMSALTIFLDPNESP